MRATSEEASEAMKDFQLGRRPARLSPKAAGLVCATIAVALVPVYSFAAVDGRDFSGIWLNTVPTARLTPVGGGAPPFNDAGKAAFAKAQADLKSGKTVDVVKKYCLPEGVPRLMSAPYPMQIVQAQNQLNIIHESHHTFRVVLMDAKHLNEDEIIESFMGDSVAHWDGDTAVIDTLGFNDSQPLDAAGLPHGTKLHIVERMRKTADGLEDLITIEDPEFYSKPWTVKAVFKPRPDLSIQEYACGEPHRALTQASKK